MLFSGTCWLAVCGLHSHCHNRGAIGCHGGGGGARTATNNNNTNNGGVDSRTFTDAPTERKGDGAEEVHRV